MSVLDNVIDYFDTHTDRTEGYAAKMELEQLRATVAQQAERIAQLEQAVEQARQLLTTLEWNDWDERVDVWLAAHPDPAEQAQPAMLHSDAKSY